MTTVGVLLAAGGGRRMGRPKALVDDWLVRGVAALQPCDRAVVVLGAQAQDARALLDGLDVEVVVAEGWAEGMGTSLRAGLAAVGDAHVLVTLVDLPDVGRPVSERLLAEPVEPATLRRAAYAGRPGHSVLLGRDHVRPMARSAVGDEGGRAYLRSRSVGLVECGDLAGGDDVDSLSSS